MIRHPISNVEPDSDRLLRLPEAAELLAISERTLWGLTKRGAVECVRVGRSVRYSRAALLAFVSKGGER